jgi:16S rRNA (cytosine1402-N4)-methyltransferase
MAALAPKAGETFIDGTFGAGGYTQAILEAAPGARVLAIDRDPSAIAAGAAIVSGYPGRLTLVEGCFSQLHRIAADHGLTLVDGVVLDVGVSSMLLDDPERGFAFQSDGPLDMRMSRTGPTAADVINAADEALLADVLFRLGEERRARAIARAIIARRAERPFARTGELAALVARVLGREKIDGRHAATRTFQALRIYVNDELVELAAGLAAAERVLAPGGRLAVVSFHSLEDGIVKRFLKARSAPERQASRHLPAALGHGRRSSFHVPSQRPLAPDAAEVRANPRARSAKLRFAVRTDAPAWPRDGDLAIPRIESTGV